MTVIVFSYLHDEPSVVGPFATRDDAEAYLAKEDNPRRRRRLA